MKRLLMLLSLVSLVLGMGCSEGTAESALPPIPVKVVVVSMFEDGELTGDEPGEFQHWVERMPLDTEYDFPFGPFPLRGNDQGVLGICIGGGIASAATSITALGLDPRFDVSQAYWVIAGIAGGDPADSTLGSAVWARHVVDGDLVYEIDGREIPENWPYGAMPLGGREPADSPADIETGWTVDNIHFELNETLVGWAYGLTKDMALPDHPEMVAARAQYTGYPAALAEPKVMIGDSMAASTYWHGELKNRWANDWMRLYGGEDAEFVTTGMEDTGSLTALDRLSRTGHVDADRVLVLRTVSNFSMPPPGKSAAWSATAPYAANGEPALVAAYEVGRKIVDAIVAGQAPDV